ncbi:CD151 [Mytilus edulis]|uniref:Tetraspanin n=1 Tax=Mytilus edulis TaxID=6550 RepID=A0A8S3U0A3_MYTED|nr:CD151 [Mytilus edulis]
MNHNARGINRRKRDMCGKNFLKVVLYVFNFFFWLTGLAFLALGLYIKFQKHTYISLLGSSTFPLSTYLLLGTGAFIILSGIIGCTGTCIENRCFMVMYALFLLIIFLTEAISGVLAYMYEGTIKEELSRNLNSTMMNNYHYDAVITKAIDDMQKEFECCDSCCLTVSTNCSTFGNGPSNINPEGCTKALEKNTKDSLILIGGIGLGLCCIQLLGIIFSCCLVRKFRGRKASSYL